MLFHGSVAEATKRARLGTRVLVTLGGQSDAAAALLSRLDAVKAVTQENGRLVVELKAEVKDYSFLAKALLDRNFALRELREEEVNLETAFMRLTKGAVQ
jgi:ABC-2 type transport system ATP-binding protein